MSASVAPFAVVRAEVSAIQRISPSFVRVSFAGAGVDGIGTPGHTFDQRIKLIFPGDTGLLPDLVDAGDDWYTSWLAVPEAERGTMRTYSIRDVVVEGGRTSIVVDFVLHLSEGSSGPASRWAAGATVGDTLLLVGPRRSRLDGGGIEFDISSDAPVLLAGDETAAPAIARILEDLPRDTQGIALIEVPEFADTLSIDAPDGVIVRWLARAGAPHGSRLVAQVLASLGVNDGDVEPHTDTEELVWETPVYSGSGEAVESHTTVAEASPARGRFWIAGESQVVTRLRRHLVRDLGIERGQVAFMGYWRIGVAMKG